MVKCAECGFLTLRKSTGELAEADEHYRERGSPATGASNYYQVPLCFMRKRDFRVDLGEHPGDTQVRSVINADILCNEFTTWHFGFTPKEHREMLDREARLRLEQELREQVWRREDTRDAEIRRLQKELHTKEM